MSRVCRTPWWVALMVAGCAPGYAEVANEVVEAPGATGVGFLDPELAVNGVRGGGLDAQSLDVFSIRPGAHLTLSWGGRSLMDGPGPDLIVFENAFAYGDEGAHFMDPTVVEVSADGQTWVAFPHDYVATDETEYVPQPDAWVGFAGVQPVLHHAEDNPLDPLSEAAGGDAFDLSDLPPAHREVRYIRLSPATDHVNPDTGEPFVRDAVSDGPDIDGVFGVVAD